MTASPRHAAPTDLHGEHPLLTPSEHRHYQAELARLRRADDPELAQPEPEVVIATRIARLEELLRDARVVDEADWDADHVVPGRIVTVRYAGRGLEVTLFVGNTPHGTIRAVSPRSPIGRALLGRAVGDAVSVELPTGRTEHLTILGVAPAYERRAA